MIICDQTFVRAQNHLDSLNYNGPLALSCDDTKLLGSLRLYYDNEKESHFLVGGVDGPIAVPDPDIVKDLMADPSITKATKVSV